MSNKPKHWTLNVQSVAGAPFDRVPRLYSKQGVVYAQAAAIRNGANCVKQVHLMRQGTALVDCTGCVECQ